MSSDRQLNCLIPKREPRVSPSTPGFGPPRVTLRYPYLYLWEEEKTAEFGLGSQAFNVVAMTGLL